MPAWYSAALKRARLEATAAALAGGRVEIGTEGMAVLLASFPLEDPAARVTGDSLVIEGLPGESVGFARGRPREAVIRTAAGALAVYGLTVGRNRGDLRVDVELIEPGQSVHLHTLQIQHA